MGYTNRIRHGNFLFFLLLITLSDSQRIGFTVPIDRRNRRFSLATDGPLSKAINDLAPEAAIHVDLILKHVTRVEDAIRKSHAQERFEYDALVEPCSHEVSWPYRRSVWRSFAMRGFPEPANNCAADVTGVRMSHDDEPGYTLSDLYDAIFNRGVAIQRRISEIAQRVIDNFTTPAVPFNYSYNTNSAHCTLTAVCLARQGEHWRTEVTISSNRVDEFVFDGQQQNIAEYVRAVDGKLGDHMLLRLPVYDDGTVERVMLDNTTTLIQSFRRNPNPSCFRAIPVHENPAMLHALDIADHSSQIVEDALTSSNLAILLLPLGLNLVPLAMIAEVNRGTILFYTILSDVLTVIPLAIKGIELVIIQRRRYRCVVTRVLSPELRNSSRPHAAGGEMWGAECVIKDVVLRAGYALIATAVVFLVLGVGLEIVVRSYTARRRSQRRIDGMETGVGLLKEGLWSHDITTIASSSRDSGITKEEDIGTGSMNERYSEALELEETVKKRFGCF